ncbi:MAG: hypothetical protein WAT66_14050 [Actinomycetota bacterium]
MTTRTTTDRRTQLRALSRALRDVHRSLVEFSRERYELAHGEVHGKTALLDLLLHDEAFAWLRPLSKIIVEIDELAARKNAPTAAEVEEIRARAEALTTTSHDRNAFGSRYVALLASEPRVAMNHGELRAAVAPSSN